MCVERNEDGENRHLLSHFIRNEEKFLKYLQLSYSKLFQLSDIDYYPGVNGSYVYQMSIKYSLFEN
jgi:hypothetical protein